MAVVGQRYLAVGVLNEGRKEAVWMVYGERTLAVGHLDGERKVGVGQVY